jgi:hypothetical protein
VSLVRYSVIAVCYWPVFPERARLERAGRSQVQGKPTPTIADELARMIQRHKNSGEEHMGHAVMYFQEEKS